MASLKEIRARIGSVKQTLKITSAMRLISSAKLHSAQTAIANMVPYEKSLRSILAKLADCEGTGDAVAPFRHSDGHRTAVVLVTSNQSLCGAFNSGLTRAFEQEAFPVDSTVVYAIGRFGLKAARKLGYETVDLCKMAEKANYDASVELSESLTRSFLGGELGRVVAIYSHFISNSVQSVTVSDYLPFAGDITSGGGGANDEYLIEPDPVEVLSALLPKVLKLSFHTMLLDAQAAEHAARTIAMQMATDNAEDLLSELSLQYNKLRQQAITNELLDLVGGQINN